MRHKALIFLSLLLYFSSLPTYAARYASIIVDERTGTVLHAANPDSQIYPASLTKMMTLYLIFEALESKRLTLNTMLLTSRRAATRPASRLGLKKGQRLSVRQIIGALVTKSANDAATVIAEKLGGTEAGFAKIMTTRARQLGMARTVFKNASGLPNRAQISTARDLAKLAMALRRNFPQHFHKFSMRRFKYRGREYRNHNRLLRYYKGTDGIKTGYVRASGYNIALSVQRSGHRLIALVFGGKSANRRDRHTKTLLRRVFKMLAENDRLDTVLIAQGYNKVRRTNTNSQQISLAKISPSAVNDEMDLNNDSWSVQVGAFNQYPPAHLAARRAARLVPLLRDARLVIKTSAGQKQRVYRSRLSGLTELRAINACKALKTKNLSCLVVKENVAQGDR